MAIAEIVVPTDSMHHYSREQHENFYRLLPRLRQGKISGEVFARARRESIPVDPGAREGGGKVKGNAAQQVLEGRAKSKKRHDEKVRQQEGQEGVLRDGKQKGSRKKQTVKGQQRVSKTEKHEEAVASARTRKKKASVTKQERKYGPKRG